MKLLSGSELAGFIKERQARQVRQLLAQKIQPKLAIIQMVDDPVINTYVRLKQAYGDDIGIVVDKHLVTPDNIAEEINALNNDDSVHGIIVQLPLAEGIEQSAVLNLVKLTKDVDGLAEGTNFDPATPIAILWLLAGYNVDTRGKQIAVVGQGRLVGAPLTKMLQKSGLNVVPIDSSTPDFEDVIAQSDIIITATGRPNLINSAMISEKAVVIDAGVAVDSGKMTGDLADDVYDREDLKMTPKKGGVGPLTVTALFDNVIKAAQNRLS